MKHILNNISQEEKNRILEQHSGGIKVNSNKFNKLLESRMGNVKPLINEEEDEEIGGEMQDNSKFDEMMRLDDELENDPKYKEYERKYLRNKIVKSLEKSMGISSEMMSEDEINSMVEMFSSIMDVSKSSGVIKKTPENIRLIKDSTIKMVDTLIQMASEDGENELVSKLENYNNVLKGY